MASGKEKYYMGNQNLPSKGMLINYTPQQIKEIDKCSKNILHFAENYFYVLNVDDGKTKINLYKAQRRVLKKMMKNRFFVLLASRQIGKALALDTPIKTPTGWSTMGELKEGDIIYGSDGQPCKVTHAHEIRYDRNCYEVEFDNGEKIIADEDHNWFTQSKAERQRKNKISGSVKTTKEIYNTLQSKDGEPLHRIPNKLSQQGVNNGNDWYYIKNIKPIDSVPVRCISVDSPDNLFLAGKTLIPTHNSTLMTIYILWMANFFPDQRILLVANKESTAIEIFSRIRMAYEMLPNWLKSPVIEYAKTSMELENNSRIGITTTTGTAGRGSSCSLLIIDECAFIECMKGDSLIKVRSKKNGEIKEISINDFIKNKTKIINHDQPNNLEFFIQNNEFEILTPDGWKDFKGIAKYSKRKLITITTENCKTITVSENHLFCNKDNNFLAKDSLNQIVECEDGFEKIIKIEEADKDYVYDIVEVEDNNKFFANGICNHNTHLMESFWASVFPIVSSSKKAKVFMCSTPNGTGNLFYDIYNGAIEGKNGWMHDKILWHEVPGRTEKWAKEIKSGLASEEKWRQEFLCEFLNSGHSSIDESKYLQMKKNIRKPIEVLMDGHYKLFELPQDDRIYVAGVDTAEGIGQDYSCVKILDITDPMEIIEVAEYYNNTIPVSEFSNKVYEILCHWGKPLVSVERNNQGGQVVDRLGYDFGYMDKIISWGTKLAGRKNHQLLGMIVSRNTKYNAVANARYYYSDRMSVQFRNEASLEEIYSDFVKNQNDSWSAVSGKHDDRTMALVWALMILHDEVIEQYFSVDEYDDCGKPSKISPLNYGMDYFEKKTSIYTNEIVDGIENSQIAPVYFGMNSNTPNEYQELLAAGWVPIDGNNTNLNYDIDPGQQAFFDKYF